jgi:tRNA1(Val) A37 N6-methylase TrmN6
VKRHDTPHDVASVLARHAPRTIRALLDPAVGTGNLIGPLCTRLKNQSTKVYCIDSDIVAVNSLSNGRHDLLPSRAKLIHSDFLEWSTSRKLKFDCILMNPPFSATKANLHQLERPVGDCGTRTRSMPIEAAFLCRAIDLLEQHGRLLAIVPCSIVMSESMQWLRDEVLARGAIRFVHELPPRSFRGVESRMYLLVFVKGARQRQISLLNHDLLEPDHLKLRLAKRPVSRLDFGYVNASLLIDDLRKVKGLSWMPLGDVATVTRGDINSPKGPTCAVHSTDFRNGFWRASKRHDKSIVECDDRRLRRGDILMSRVGRNAHRSCGRGIGIKGMACSDCIIIVRPNRVRMGTRILFALRIVLSQPWAKPLVERGTGASYISHRSLLELPVPMGACERYPRLFKKFERAERVKSARQSTAAVMAAGTWIEKLRT